MGGEVASERYPGILGIQPVFGRGFTSDEVHRPDGAAVALIGHGLWARRFGADPAAVGRQITINARPYTIVGVLPPGFRGLTGAAQIWLPLGGFEPSMLGQAQNHSYSIRRDRDIPEDGAIAAVRHLGPQIEAAHPSNNPLPYGATAASLAASRADVDVRRASLILLGAVGFVLLIACVNLTNLLWVRASTRRREVGVHVAIGATRIRIVRQFLAEGLMLSVAGGMAGLLLAWILLHLAGLLLPEPDVFFRTSIAPGLARRHGAAGLTRIGASMIAVDTATLLYTCGVSMITALMVSLVPALQSSLTRPVDALRSAGKAVGGTARGLSARGVLVTVQIAVALVLMTGAGLMVRSASRLYATDIGVHGDRVLTVTIDLPRASYTAETGTAFFTQLLERVRALPGVQSAAFGSCAPVSGGCNGTTIWFPTAPRRGGPGRDPIVGIYWATPELLPTLGIRLLAGRNFTEHDREGQPRVVLVNEAAARAFWPNDSAIGKRVAAGYGGLHEGAVEVVGVVSNVRYMAMDAAPRPDIYIPFAQSYRAPMRLFVRTSVAPESLVPAIGREVRALDPNLPLSEVKSTSDRVADAMWRTRVGTWLLSAFAGLALLLTAIGVFGVMAQTVTQRTAEIGIRVALGARRRDVRLVLGRAALVTGLGLAAGIAAALAATRLMSTLLYEVEPYDPITFASVAALLGGVSLLASYLPARRAAAVDAIVALRTE